jgi:predicted metal-dependent enzyme (double-stranded beta helix superfamily)
MPELAPNPLAGLAETVGRCLDAGGPAAIAHAVREALAARIAAGAVALPPSATQPFPDRYARRLVHRDPDGRFSIVAMAWGPGQGTAVHDHDGSWCVEGVLRGTTFSVPYRLVEVRGDRHRFEVGEREVIALGDTGAIFPPYEHHVYGNADAFAPALTLHVYGPELLRCACYTREEDGTWTRRERALTYDPW